MKSVTAVTVVVLIASLVSGSHGYCHAKAIMDKTHCEVDGHVIQQGGSYKFTSKCEECTCGMQFLRVIQLSCCGYGIHAGVMMPPPGCLVVADTDGCTPKKVDANDPTQPCSHH